MVVSDHEVNVLDHRDVWIEGNRIVAITPVGSIEKRADEIIDAEGQLLMPGLINCHSHHHMDDATCALYVRR